MLEKGLQSDPRNERFASVMVILARVGLITMAICGFLWFFNFDPLMSRNIALANCSDSASLFWKAGAAIHTGGYAWFLTRLNYTDFLTIFGVSVLASAPLVSMLATIPRCSRKVYLVFMIAIVLELTFAVVRPILMKGGALAL